MSEVERVPLQALSHEIRVETEYERLIRPGLGANSECAQQITPVEQPFTTIPGERDAGIDQIFAALDGGGSHGVRDLGGRLVHNQRDLVFTGEKPSAIATTDSSTSTRAAVMAGTTASRPLSSTVMPASTASRSISFASPATRVCRPPVDA